MYLFSVCKYTIISLCVALHSASSPSSGSRSSAKSSGDFFHMLNENKFVDSTLFLRWLQNGDTSYITAPRRFGKTTMVDMIHRFYEIPVASNGSVTPKESSESFKMFKGKYLNSNVNLAITQDTQFFAENFGSRPVLRLNFKTWETSTYAAFIKNCALMVRDAYVSVQFLDNSDKLDAVEKEELMKLKNIENTEDFADIRINLGSLIDALYTHFSNTKVLIIIDELDEPIQKMLTAPIGPEQDKMTKDLQSLIGYLLKDHLCVWRGVCVGIIRLSGFFLDDANNINHEAFHAKKAIALNFASTVKNVEFLKEQYTEHPHTSVEIAKRYYDGYRVQESRISAPVEVFSTFSVRHYFETGHPCPGWTGVSRVPFLSAVLSIGEVNELIKESILGYPITVLLKKKLEWSDFKKLRNTIDRASVLKVIDADFSFRDCNMVMQYFFELGYYTSVDSPVEEGDVKLRVPNQEIRHHLINLFVEWFTKYFDFKHDARTYFQKNMTAIGGNKQNHKYVSICVADLFQKSVHLPANLDQFTSACLTFLQSGMGNDDGWTIDFEPVQMPGQGNFDPSRFIFLRRDNVLEKCTLIVFGFSFKGNSFISLKKLVVKDYNELRKLSPESCKGDVDLLLIGLNFSGKEILSSILYNTCQIEQAKNYSESIKVYSRVIGKADHFKNYAESKKDETRATFKGLRSFFEWLWSRK